MKFCFSLAMRLLLLLSLVSCVSTTTIRATSINEEVDKDVKIYVNDVFLGKGEVQYSDRNSKSPFKAIVDPVVVKLKKPGCAVLKENLKVIKDNRNYFTSLGLIVLSGGIMFFPLLYAPTNPEDISTSFTFVGVGTIALIASMVPMGWMYKYKPIHNFEYLCAKKAAKIIQ